MIFDFKQSVEYDKKKKFITAAQAERLLILRAGETAGE